MLHGWEAYRVEARVFDGEAGPRPPHQLPAGSAFDVGNSDGAALSRARVAATPTRNAHDVREGWGVAIRQHVLREFCS